MKPEWLIYAETVWKEIDEMPAKKSGKNVERHLSLTWQIANSIVGLDSVSP